mmetsp:Transcript_23380/g.65249  ORF Transcript_23380/g.65249 Transcript_23380/m.65249 type:complete len:180 (-) Transcript_23380:42-581(-)
MKQDAHLHKKQDKDVTPGLISFVQSNINANSTFQTINESAPLHLACQRGNVDVVQSLLYSVKSISSSIYPNTNFSIAAFNNFVRFQLACKNGHTDVVESLLCLIRFDRCVHTRISFTMQGLSTCTPMRLACQKGNAVVVGKVLCFIETNCGFHINNGISIPTFNDLVPLHTLEIWGYGK